MTKMIPFRMIGNLYFVGTREASCHMIDTGDGLILIDTGCEENAETVTESVTALGFDMRDVKIILHSHGHYDHSDATAKLLKLTPNAKTYLSRHDVKYIKGFTPDFDICDGDEIALGNTRIKCLFTPGHTEGSVSFFFDVVEDGVSYRCAMFGGAGTNQLKKDYMDKNNVPYLCRGLFLDSVERLMLEKVDVMVGNHSWHNDTQGKYERMATSSKNPFIDPEEWRRFLTKMKEKLYDVVEGDVRDRFVNYAHRGASEYCPENTFTSFYTGVYMGANGIETDVRATKDGVLVLFHDGTLERVVGEAGGVADYTYEELSRLRAKRGALSDRIPTFEDFLAHFAHMDLHFAIELKASGIESEVADLLLKYGMEKKTVVTSFNAEYIRKIKEYASSLRVGFLTKSIDKDVTDMLIEMGADEICPYGAELTREDVARLHRIGFNVRAWGISDESVMKRVFDIGADGMTVNFPDKLTEYVNEQRK